MICLLISLICCLLYVFTDFTLPESKAAILVVAVMVEIVFTCFLAIGFRFIKDIKTKKLNKITSIDN